MRLARSWTGSVIEIMAGGPGGDAISRVADRRLEGAIGSRGTDRTSGSDGLEAERAMEEHGEHGNGAGVSGHCETSSAPDGVSATGGALEAEGIDMNEFTEIRGDLTHSLHELLRRYARIEQGMEEQRILLESSRSVLEGCRRELRERLDRVAAEAARVESAIRRIDRREFDCCILCGGRIPVAALRRAPFTSTCPNCSDSYPLTYGDEMRLQHSSLRALLRATRERLAELVLVLESEGADIDSEAAAARVLLLDFEHEVLAHHAAEERDETLSAACQQAPRLSRSAESLLREHVELARNLASIREDALAVGPVADEWRPIAARFELLALALCEHEEEENALLAAAFLDDIGTAD
jgi:RNA polymerase-binding transcription factor DksA